MRSSIFRDLENKIIMLSLPVYAREDHFRSMDCERQETAYKENGFSSLYVITSFSNE